MVLQIASVMRIRMYEYYSDCRRLVKRIICAYFVVPSNAQKFYN